MRFRTRPALILIALSLVAADAMSSASDARDTRLFKIDKSLQVVGPAGHVPPVLAVQLVSVTTDQPQVWPDEVVRLRVAMPGRGGQALAIRWHKRDATAREVPGVVLDADGLAVLELADGKKERLELGEYRVEVQSADGKAKGAATFAVVEGALGALSLAHAFERVTSPAQLDAVKAGWYLGNAGGAGSRWGNGLSFKNELRVDNAPYDGPVDLVPRCMLSGCNGVVAGPRQTLQVNRGQLAGTLEISGHSGPFQIELITPHGSLRHQFEGSGHVEREMIPISKGVRYLHRVGLAPYSGTVQVPGRNLFVDRQGDQAADAFEVASPIVPAGKLEVKARVALTKVALMVWEPQGDGSFKAVVRPAPAEVKAGEVVSVAVGAVPMALVAIGGVAKGASGAEFREGYVMALPAGGIHATVRPPVQAAPNATAQVEIDARDAAGQPLAVAGILEAWDIRVAARDPASPLASAIGDSVRTAGRHLDSWVDPVELERQRKEEERLRKEEEKRDREERRKEAMAERKVYARKAAGRFDEDGLSVSGSGAGGGGVAYGYGAASMGAKKAVMAAPSVRVGGPGRRDHDHGDDDGGEEVRKGEVKIAFVGVVRTGADGRARVAVPTPPQTGRLAFRFTPVRGLDWATAEAQCDLVRQASVEVRAPRTLVAGGTLDLHVTTDNRLSTPLLLRVSGAGFDRPVERPVGSGRHSHLLSWPAQDGELVAALVDDSGRVHDKRALPIHDVGRQKVTWSRLATGGSKAIVARAGDTIAVYSGPGGLLNGIVSNMVTTMESWFPHAEALSAQVAVRATLLAAIQRGLIGDDGHGRTLHGGLEQAILKLQRECYDAASRQIRPYPGMAPSPRWSAWVAANLHVARRALKFAPPVRQRMGAAAQALDQLAKDLGDGMVARGERTEPQGFSAARDGEEVVEIEVEGAPRFEVVTDDAVQQFVVDKLAPALDDCGDDCADDAKALGKALDRFRLQRAFARVGRLQWLVGQARAALAAGPKGQAAFETLFGVVARGFVLSQEPGMIQGPALLGGVYSQPMALPRFLELLLAMGARPSATGAVSATVGGQTVRWAFGETKKVSGATELRLPVGAIARIDRAGTVDLRAGAEKPFARAAFDKVDLPVGGQGVLTVELAADRDPLEYYAFIAVPTTVAIRQTEDALSDYKGQLIYGQQSMGASKMQVIAVPFRGLRTMRIWIEGFLPGQAPGLVAVRHVHDADQWCSVTTPPVRVRGADPAPQEIRATR